MTDLRIFDHAGRVVVVTGAGSGIGRACAGLFAQQGATVVVNDIREQPACAVADEFHTELLPEAIADVTDPAAARAMIDAVVARYDRIDVLVNNAAAPVELGPFAGIAPQQWSTYLSSLYAVLSCTRASLAHMSARGWGRIINITSIAGSVGVDNMVLYGAGKGGIHAFSAGLAKEIAETGVTINCIAPGTVETPRQMSRSAEERAARADRVPMKRFAKPAEIAAAAVFLASEQAAYITGEVLLIDGGRP